jgi:PKD repeat protein
MFELAHSFFRKSTGRSRRAPSRPRGGRLGVEALEDRSLPSASLVAAYSFNEGTGLAVADSSGNGNTGTISNATWTAAGRFGNALSFNGTNSWVTVPDSPSVSLTTGMTLEAWVKPTTTSGSRNVLMKEQTGGLSYGLYASSPDKSGSSEQVQAHTTGGNYAINGSGNLPLNTWSFLAATFDGSWMRLYVNGQQVSKQKVSGSILEPGGALRIGGDSVWGEYFSGQIDNVRVYNGAISQAQMRSDMSTPITSSSPVANAGPSESGNEGAPVAFAGSVTGGTAPYTYSWSFGDGGTTTGTLTPAHAYADNGTYTVTLTVTDSLGLSSQASTTAVVANVAPTASAGGPYSGTAGSPVAFSASATDPSPVDTAAGFTYAWNFGDGTTGSGATPAHTYAAGGTYTASVIVTDKDGGQGTAQTSVTVVAAPPVASAGPDESGPEGSAITFAGSVTGGQAPLSYFWAFGDGGTATGTLTPTHMYQEAGRYTATLTVTDSLGRTSTSSDTVTMTEVTPTASAGGPYSGTAGTAIAFSGSATDAPADLAGMQYAWSFGDGATATGQAPSHAYPAAGTYTVTLTVTDPDGLTASASTTATVTLGTDPLLKPVLNQSDFTYLGSFMMPASANGWSTAGSFGGLAFHYVNGQLHFFSTNTVNSGGQVYEVNFPGLGTGSSMPVAQVMHNWGDIYTGQKWIGNNGGTSDITASWTYGLYYDQAAGRLYWNYGNGYNATNPYNPSFGYSVLNDSTGVATGVGAWSLANRSEKMDRGGVTPIPQWFADRFTGGATLAVGFGGYFSIISSPDSMGPALAAVAPPNISANPDQSALANVPLLGYPWGTPGPGRAQRDPNYTSYYDGGTYPTTPGPWNPSGGVGYWTWNDIVFQGGTWIDMPNKQGVLFIAKVGQGAVYYQNSDRHTQGGAYEWLVYDPKDLAAVASGLLQQWQIQPKYEWTTPTLPLNPQDVNGWSGDGVSQIGGVTFDPASGRLFVLENSAYQMPGQVEWDPEVFVYQVGSPPTQTTTAQTLVSSPTTTSGSGTQTGTGSTATTSSAAPSDSGTTSSVTVAGMATTTGSQTTTAPATNLGTLAETTTDTTGATIITTTVNAPSESTAPLSQTAMGTTAATSATLSPTTAVLGLTSSPTQPSDSGGTTTSLVASSATPTTDSTGLFTQTDTTFQTL